MDKALFATLITAMNKVQSGHAKLLADMQEVSNSYQEVLEVMERFANSSSELHVRVESIEARLEAAGL